MHVVHVSLPGSPVEPLTIEFELSNAGQTTIAVSQSQFSAALQTAQDPWFFVSDVSFPADAPAVFVLRPGDRMRLTVKSLKDRVSGKLWSEAVPTESILKLYINGGKAQEFPDQWRGQTYSDEYRIVRPSSG